MSEQPENEVEPGEARVVDEPAAAGADAPTAESPTETVEVATTAPAPTEPAQAESPPQVQSPEIPATEPLPGPPPAWQPPVDAATASESGGLLVERPEIAVGAAFAGGLLLALILKRLAD